jgi:hypothetical protein
MDLARVRCGAHTDRMKRTLGAVAATGVLLLGAISSTSLAATAAGTDHLTGIVTYANGTPLPGIYLELADALDPGTPRGAAYTDREGRFDLSTERDAVIVVAYDTVRNRLAPTPVHDGAPIVVDGNVDVGPVVMTHGATVSGTLTSTVGGPVNHAYAALAFGPDGTPDRGTVTDREGRYMLSGLAPGTHHITFWDHAHLPVETDVTVTRDQQVSGLDVTLTAREPTAQELADTDVSGRVVDGAGRPVANVGVYAMFDDAPFSDLPAGPVGWTGADGVYRLQNQDPSSGSPAGVKYRLLFREIDDDDYLPGFWQVRAGDDTFGVAPTYYPGSPTFDGADEFAISEEPVGPLDDVVLGDGGGISGTVAPPRHSDGSPRDDWARAVDAAGHVADEGPVTPGGEYRLRDLQPGVYLVSFSAEEGNWWPSGPREQAQSVTVTAGMRTAGVGTVPDRSLPLPSAPPPELVVVQPPAPVVVTQTPLATAPAASATTATAKAAVRRTRVVLRVTVSASGGAVTVSERGRTRGTAAVVDGHAVVRLDRPHRGRHTYTVTFSGTASAAPSTTTVRVRVE